MYTSKDRLTDFTADSLIMNENCKLQYHTINRIYSYCLWTNLKWLEQSATVWGSAMVSWWTWLKWGTIHEHICGHIGPYWAAPVWKMWRRACWGQTTIKRSSDFTHMMIIKIVVRVKYGKWYWNPDTVYIYLTTLQLLIFTLAQTISNSNSNIHEQLSAITPENVFEADWICGRVVVEFTCVFGNYAFRVTCNNVGALLALCDLISAIYCSSAMGWKSLWIAIKFLPTGDSTKHRFMPGSLYS